MTECKHGLLTVTCTLCNSSRKPRGVYARLQTTCRLCRLPIYIGDRIAKRLVTGGLYRSVWAHESCPSYVMTRSEQEELTGRRDPVGTTPKDHASRAQITFWAQDEEE